MRRKCGCFESSSLSLTRAKAMSADVQREIEMLRKRQDKWLMYGWIVAGVMILIAGGAYFYSQAKVENRKNAQLAYEKAMTDLQAEITAMGNSINSIDAANKLIARAEATKTTIQMPDGRMDTGWKDTYVADVTGKITSAVGKATNYIKTTSPRFVGKLEDPSDPAAWVRDTVQR